MKLAFFGSGGMGTVVIARARADGHHVGAVVTSREAGSGQRELAALLKGHDVAIDFSVGKAVFGHATACVLAGVPLVEGTTGWKKDERGVIQFVEDAGGAMVYGPNFSIGVNVFLRVVARAAELFGGLGGYDAFLEEAHHAKKKDAPSGTAILLRDLVQHTLGKEPPVASIRAGHIPGTHTVGFDSAADQVTLTHTARSREGFADGALLAARWIAKRRGVYAFTDVLDDILGMERKKTR
ncbi:MAG: dihydrodipicolinate reductase [Gemmatimonadetes bacterium]|nr:dihydrodipicolinate reductase [Gemmatimonadota bacterium]